MKQALRILAVCLAITSHGLDASAQNVGAAQDLFDRGKAALLHDEFAEACPLLEESYRLEPAGGTLQNLAVCYERLGKTGTAYARFQELKARSLAAKPPRNDRVQIADEHIAKLSPRLSRLQIVMPSANREAAATLTVDSALYGPASWDGIVVDPGPHAIEVSAPQRVPFRVQLTVAHAGTALRVRVPILQPAPTPATSRGPSANGQAYRTAGFVTAAAGVALLVAGSTVGVLAAATNGRAERRCAENGACDADRNAQANELRGDARAFANVATVALPIGLVAAAAGALLLWQGYRHEPRRNAAFLTPALGGLHGRF